MATHPSIFDRPMVHEDAARNVEALLATPSCRVIAEEEEFWESLRNEVRDVKTTMVAEFSELKHRIASLETHVAGLHRNVASVHEDLAIMHGRIDKLADRVERVERRLELTDAA